MKHAEDEPQMASQSTRTAATIADTPGLGHALLARLSKAQAEPSVLVAVSSLLAADSPRLAGLDPGHAETLAGTEADLPPILVRRSTMQVIDGMHRLDAARLRGDKEICVRLFDCTQDEAFMLAVATNVRHGLPLTLADRRSAAARIIGLRPDASDRWIAELAGLAAKTVAGIRQEFPEASATTTRRIGRDGRVRPVTAAEGRRLASELLTEDPQKSLRHVARTAGISVGTVRDVRDKLRQGIDPVQPRRLSPLGGTAPITLPRKLCPVDYRPILERLRQDPSLRYTDSGRSLLRWLVPPRLVDPQELQQFIDLVPPHCRFDIIRIARGCAFVWAEFAEELDRRIHDVPDADEQAQPAGNLRTAPGWPADDEAGRAEELSATAAVR
jgi:ParB-like chromosome segregation protein Spo0J